MPLLLAAWLTTAGPVGAANGKVRWLQDHAASVRTNDPADEDFSDLEPLRQAIGDARLVLLGEASHGSGGDFLAKGRLIKFLHQEMGFDVLAWESGLFDCGQMEQALHSSLSLEAAVARGVFTLWGQSTQARPVFEYARQTHGTNRPLEMAGFDIQFSAWMESQNLFPASIVTFFDAADPSLLSSQQREQIFNLLPVLATAIPFNQATTDQQRQIFELLRELMALIDRAGAALARVHSARDIAFQKRVLVNAGFLENYYPVALQISNLFQAVQIRDEAMADNLSWLLDQYYPNRRVIVWAHNGHIVRSNKLFLLDHEPAGFQTAKWMGEYIAERYGDQAYSIAFLAYEGETQFVSSSVPPRSFVARGGSIEKLMHKTGYPFLFLGFRSEQLPRWLTRERIAAPFDYYPQRAVWPDIWDAFFFSDVMVGSTQ